MSRYDELLSQLSASVTSAGEYIPLMCDALKEEKLSKEDIRDKVMKDCLAAGLARGTVTNNMPEEYKDEQKVKAGKKGAATKKDKIQIHTDGSTAPPEDNSAHSTGAETSPNDEKEEDSKTFQKVTKDVEYQPPTPVTKAEKFLANKVNELMEINKFQAREISKLKTVSKVEGVGALNEKDIDCTDHSMYHKAQAKIENQQREINELQARVDAFDKINFTPATDVPSPPDLFQVPKENEETANEKFYPSQTYMEAIKMLRQFLNRVDERIDIGWRIVEQ
jgi:hypothetical protein